MTRTLKIGEDDVEAVIEIPRGSRNKYETDEETGAIFLDRVLYSSIHFPGDYGFIPATRAPDGDPLDVIIIVEDPTFPGCHVHFRPIGVLCMCDEAGLDRKILGVPVADPRFDGLRNLDQIHPRLLTEFENFFAIYKMLEDKESVVEGWQDAVQAKDVIRHSRLIEQRRLARKRRAG
jgi:inorganic pyrophosphatase